MNFRSGINLVLSELRSGFNNTRSKSNGSPLKKIVFRKSELGLKNFRRRPIDIRIKSSGFNTNKKNIREGVNNLKSSLNNCSSKVSHQLQTGFNSAASGLSNVLSNAKIERPGMDNLKAKFQSTVHSGRAKLQNSLDSGLEKTRSGLDNVRNSLDSGLENTRSGLNNVRSQLSNARILDYDEICSKLSARKSRLKNSFQSGIRNTRSKTYSSLVESVESIVRSEINNTRKGQYLFRIGYEIIQLEFKTRPRRERRNRSGIFNKSKENLENWSESKDNRQYRSQTTDDCQYQSRSEENFQDRYRSENSQNFQFQSKEDRQYRNRSEENRKNQSRSEENDRDWFQSDVIALVVVANLEERILNIMFYTF